MEKDFVKTGSFKFVTYLVALAVILMFLGQAFDVPSRTVDVEAPEIDTSALDAAVVALLNVSVGDNSDVIAILNEDEDWEDAAEKLATEEWEARDFKDIADFLDDLDDRDDIIYVREDTATTFDGMDSDDEDAIVTQYIKVKYEDDSGDDKKVYLTIESGIEEGEVEDQEITVTD